MSSENKSSISIRYLIPLLFAVVIIITVSAIAYLSFRSGQQTINDLTIDLTEKIASRIEEHVHSFLNSPHALNKINTIAIQNGNLDPDNFSDLERTLWRQVQVEDSIPFIYLGNESGEFLGVQKIDTDTYATWFEDESTIPVMYVYQLDEQLNKVETIDTIDYFDPRIRPWYQAAVEKGAATWSEVFPDISRPILIITAVQPVFDLENNLLGVWGIELSLEQISQFLRSLEISPTGTAFIVDSSGNIVADSSTEAPYRETDDGPARLHSTESNEPLIQHTALFIEDKFGSFDIQDGQLITYRFQNDKMFAQIKPLRDDRGLDWLIVVVIPENDLMAPVYANLKKTILLGFLVLLAAIGAGTLLASWITSPISRIVEASIHIHTGDFDISALEKVATRGDELGKLASFFQLMAAEIRKREENLKQQVKELQIKIDEEKRGTQVKQIVDSDFFHHLVNQASHFRQRKEQRNRHSKSGKSDQTNTPDQPNEAD